MNDSVVEATNWMNDPARMHAPGAAAGTGVLGAKSTTPGAGTGETEGLSSTSNEPEGADQLNEDGAEKQPKKKGRARRNSDDSSLDSQDEELDRQLAEDFKFVRKTLPRSAISHEEERMEFRCLDYSPLVNVRPIDLSDQFRPVKACRKIRLYIAITAYNEEGDELRRTLMGIADNLPKLAKAGLHWSEVCVCILIDGREAASQSMLDFLQFDLKLYDPTILRTVHRERPVVMHVFERSVEMSKHATQREYHYPLQCMLALKERNGGKLNSHLWFFSGFCVQVNPKYTLLFDVGTVPHKNAIVRMYIGMEDDPQIGGACGEISVRNARPWHFLDAAQAFEYKISHGTSCMRARKTARVHHHVVI
ncbi:MAG: hypothetical protein EOO65_03190 [Methanosarcinales archaeon]|nr:MAG: hypothetical protein EOO65_03190 [Methanosarcinales archaeon]